MSLRFVVRTFLALQRLEVFLAVMLPFFLIFESSLANGSVYAGGHLDFATLNGWIAFGRGLFFEVLTYASARLTKIILVRSRGWQQKLSALLPASVSLWCIIVSAGNNLGWVLSGGEFEGIFSSMGHFMPSSFLFVYQMGLGLLLPLSVGVLALVDVSHLIHAAIEDSSLDGDATEVLEAEMHRTGMMKAAKKTAKETQGAYQNIAKKRAQEFVKRAESGDLTFTSSKKKQQQPQARTSVIPIQHGAALPAPGQAHGTFAPAGAAPTASLGPMGQGQPTMQPFAQPGPQAAGSPGGAQFPPNLQPQGQNLYRR